MRSPHVSPHYRKDRRSDKKIGVRDKPITASSIQAALLRIVWFVFGKESRPVKLSIGQKDGVFGPVDW